MEPVIVPQAALNWINMLLERNKEPIRFIEITIDERSVMRLKGKVKRLLITAEVEVTCTMSEKNGHLVFSNIHIGSSSFGVDIILHWMQNSLIGDIKELVEPFGIVIVH